jgi:voltage-gated potassium channel Kch
MSPEGEPADRMRQRLAILSARERRQALFRTAFRSVVAFAVILGIYFLLPVGDWGGDGWSAFRLVLGVLIFAAILAWQVWRILQSRLPALQAIEALIVAIPTFIVVYASTYVGISAASPGSFSQALDKPASLYFTVVTLGTVGYGDIAPVSVGARMAVSSQIMLGLVLISVIIRLLAGAARRSLDRNADPPAVG